MPRLEKYGVRSHRRSRPAAAVGPEPAPAPRPPGHADSVREGRGIALPRRRPRGAGRRRCRRHPRAELLEGRDRHAADVRAQAASRSVTPTERSWPRSGSSRSRMRPRRAAHAAMVIQKGAARAREANEQWTPGVKIGIHVAQVLVGSVGEPGRHRRGGPKRAQWAGARSAPADHRDETRSVASAGAAAPIPERPVRASCRFDGGAAPGARSRPIGSRGRNAGGWAIRVGAELTKFVGRHVEVEVSRQRRWPRRGMGSGQLVAVVGEPGVGKSRSCWEVDPLRRMSLAGSCWKRAPCSYGKIDALSPA